MNKAASQSKLLGEILGDKLLQPETPTKTRRQLIGESGMNMMRRKTELSVSCHDIGSSPSRMNARKPLRANSFDSLASTVSSGSTSSSDSSESFGETAVSHHVCGTISSSMKSRRTTPVVRKSVRFATDCSTGRLLLGKHDAPKTILSKADVKDLWWTAADYHGIRRSCKEQARQASATKEVLVDFCSVFDACLSGNLYTNNVHTSSGARPHNSNPSQQHLMLTQQSEHGTASSPRGITKSTAILLSEELDECIRIVASTQVRGLESLTFPPLKKHRRRALERFILAQSKLPKSMNIHERELILASKSRLLSRPFRQLAWVMAIGDELNVKSER